MAGEATTTRTGMGRMPPADAPSGRRTKAYAELLRLYPNLIAVATLWFGKGCRRDASERAAAIVQELGAVVGRLPDTYDDTRPLGPYLFAALRYMLIAATFRGPRPVAGPEELDLVDPQPNPFEACERDEAGGRVRGAVERLGDPYRRVIVLRFWSGLSPAEIAATLGVPRATVDVWIFRAKKILADSLADLAP